MSLKRLGKDTVIYGGADFFTKFLAFFTFPIIASALSPRAFGELDLIVTTIGLAGLFMNCGINNAVQRFYWDKDVPVGHQPTLVSSGLAVQILFGLVLASGGILIAFTLNNYIQSLGVTFSLIALLSASVLMFATQVLQFILDITRLHFAPFKFLTLSVCTRILSSVLAVIAVVYFHAGINGYMVVSAISLICILPLGIWLVRQDITMAINKDYCRKLIHFGYPFIFMGIAYWLFGAMDRWMLATMSSVEETGIYSIAFRFSSVVLFVSLAFGQAWSPYALKYKSDHPEHYRRHYANILIFILYVMLAIGGGVALFSGEILSVILPVEYIMAAIPLSILCFSVVMQATQHITALGISLENKTYLFARLAWVSALINFLGNYALIPLYGAMGAAAASLLSYLFLTGCYMYHSQKLHTLPIEWNRVIFLIVLGVIVFILSIVFSMTHIDWYLIALKLVICIVCLGLGFLALPYKEVFHAKA
jgi:O-antigen/teichoic acid export membrane protein